VHGPPADEDSHTAAGRRSSLLVELGRVSIATPE
jgi:hypothetical protein